MLARGAIENFATALWLLGPRSRSDRIARLLRWHAKNIIDSHNAVDRIAPAVHSREARLADLEKIAVARLGAIPPRFKGYTTTEVVKYADEFRAPNGALNTQFIWQVCSGFAHARPWTQLNVLERDFQDTEDPDILHGRFTSSMGRALMAPRHALELCGTVFGRYDALNTPTFRA